MDENALLTFGGTESGILIIILRTTNHLKTSVLIIATNIPTKSPELPKYFIGNPVPDSPVITGVNNINEERDINPADIVFNL